MTGSGLGVYEVIWRRSDRGEHPWKEDDFGAVGEV